MIGRVLLTYLLLSPDLCNIITGTSIFEILSTVYTAVTLHELFKEAAMDANSKLDFGVEWQEIFNVLQSGTSRVERAKAFLSSYYLLTFLLFLLQSVALTSAKTFCVKSLNPSMKTDQENWMRRKCVHYLILLVVPLASVLLPTSCV